MKKTKKTKKPEAVTETKKSEKKVQKAPAKKFGVLGKDLSSQYSTHGDRSWRPTKAGGRNGQGKP